MSNVNQFLQEFSKLCLKHDMEICANSKAELVIYKISTGERLVTDLNCFFYSKQINYTDVNDSDIDLTIED